MDMSNTRTSGRVSSVRIVRSSSIVCLAADVKAEDLLPIIGPVGYERRIPSILVETFYFGYGTSGWMQWYQGPGDEFGGNGDLAPTYILANGDTTGYGLQCVPLRT